MRTGSGMGRRLIVLFLVTSGVRFLDGDIIDGLVEWSRGLMGEEFV